MITSDTYVTTVGSFATEVTHTYSPAIGRISDDQWEQMQMPWRCDAVLRHGAGNYNRRTFISEHSLIMMLDEYNYDANPVAPEYALGAGELADSRKFTYRRTRNG